MKENILKLRAEGKSYRVIQKILGCSRGTIAFHCGEGQKHKTYLRRRKINSKFMFRLRQEMGGKCSLCEYKKCMAALEFHHPNENKEGCVCEMLRDHGFDAARKEAKKCILMCANCHRELHYTDDGVKKDL